MVKNLAGLTVASHYISIVLKFSFKRESHVSFLNLQMIHCYPQKVLCYAMLCYAKSLQSCPTLCDPIDGRHRLPRPWDSPGKNIGVGCHSFSNAWKWKVKVKLLSRVRLLATPWTAAYQAPSSMGFSRQEYWSGVPLPSEGAGAPKWFLFINVWVAAILLVLAPQNLG